MQLLIVESPTKAKKIRGYLPNNFRVMASMGHVRDLPPQGDLAIHFTANHVSADYEVIPRAQRTMQELRQQLGRAERVLLATDPDREGEAIAWHLVEALQPQVPTARVSFNAITKSAVLAALEQARPIDQALVGAQQARRLLDRVVGWVVSPTLRQALGKEAKSAGRVQSAALRLVAERERAIQAFDVTKYFTLQARLLEPQTPPAFTAKLVTWKHQPLGHRLAEAKPAEATADWCRQQDWVVAEVLKKNQHKSPPPPFVTATVQQAASVQLRRNPKQVMTDLQALFEDGWITYHRTDSVAVDPAAIDAARAFIQARFAPEYLPAKAVQHQGKAANTQEAHEAIRPIDLDRPAKDISDADQRKLYQLIAKRFIASQMTPGKDAFTTIRVAIAPDKFILADTQQAVPMGIVETKGKVMLFDGWRKVLGEIDQHGARQKTATKRTAKKAKRLKTTILYRT